MTLIAIKYRGMAYKRITYGFCICKVFLYTTGVEKGEGELYYALNVGD